SIEEEQQWFGRCEDTSANRRALASVGRLNQHTRVRKSLGYRLCLIGRAIVNYDNFVQQRVADYSGQNVRDSRSFVISRNDATNVGHDAAPNGGGRHRWKCQFAIVVSLIWYAPQLTADWCELTSAFSLIYTIAGAALPPT